MESRGQIHRIAKAASALKAYFDRCHTGVCSLGRLVLAAMRAWVQHRAPSKGAALAFYALFSMAPILVLVMGIAGAVLGSQAVEGELYAQLKDLVGPVGALAVQSLVADAHLPGTGHVATWLASILLVVGATSLFVELKDSLDDIWNVHAPVPTGLKALLQGRILSFCMVMVLGLLLLAILVLRATLVLAGRFWEGHWTPAPDLVTGLSRLFVFVVVATLFGLIYKMLPEVKLSWRDVAIGALSTAALFSLGNHLIGVYLVNNAVGSSFGVAGSVAALLIWVYYSAQVFFLGAEFTREFALSFGSLRGHQVGSPPRSDPAQSAPSI
ncbi:MAG TPA: YihY/virulence factor BrkB family protein [Geothrix sp.]